MNAELNTALRAATVEDAWWRFFVTYRLQLADCDANQNMLEGILENQTLPISFDNLSAVWEALTPEQKSQFAPSRTGEVKPRRDTNSAAATVEVPSAEVEVEGMPTEWTPEKIRHTDRATYKKLISQYGFDAINDRLAGRS